MTSEIAGAGFSGLADGMRRRISELLVAAGRPEEAARILEERAGTVKQHEGEESSR